MEAALTCRNRVVALSWAQRPSPTAELGVGESLRSAGAARFGFDHVVVDQLTRRTCNHGGSARRRVPATSTRSAQPVHTRHGV
ncbi:hypothetical protein DSI35_27005 [Mycobacterium tuberculosis]|uniref:Uncharacterized protein n=3 Tax=Mycobacterium tuberculosis TaxID=1773 RepID=Q8VKP2_MYCTO|nr:hypothetical protein MT0270.2 [Mycobacterium tuberculosis CDC1551]APR55771.1 hypothetical protein BTU11_01390 [Mycobacterium tuberculosis]AVK88590.1 hypothetical protein C1D11_01395 [Mycobacterium tuberculosis variant bovis]AYP10765.1 hypothetical protein EBQ37_01820 [Mycobacterium tuberculosis variant bovis BCG]EFD75897.1 conserved hypothetical protein [Mycobacterium tuberculosis GM 1503]PRH90465.1 hypothetical protein B8A26_18120 [Mycobacterium tuberculosis variant pinnipedii]PRH98456.1 